MSSFYSTIIVFTQKQEPPPFDTISPDTKFNFKRDVSSQTEDSNST